MKRISKALIAINKRIIIVIEDIDRNILLLDDKPSYRNQKAKQTFEGFLYRIKEATNISYILNIGPKAYQFLDFQKLSDKTFVMPKIKPELIKDIFIPVRKYLIEYSKGKGDIDPCEEERSKVDLNYVEDILTHLLEYPRIFKVTLRRSADDWGIWDKKKKSIPLHGEVDIDQLLLLNMLRKKYPTEFSAYANYKVSETLHENDEKTPENDNTEKDYKPTPPQIRIFSIIDMAYYYKSVYPKKSITMGFRMNQNVRSLLGDMETLQGMGN